MKRLFLTPLFFISLFASAQTIKQKQVDGLGDSLATKTSVDDNVSTSDKTWSSNKINRLFNSKALIYQKSDRAFSSAFTATGSGYNFTSGNINYSGSGGATFDLNTPGQSSFFYHAYEHWEVKTTVKINSMAANDAGFRVGMHANTGMFGFQFKAHPANGNIVLISLILNNSILTLLGQFTYTNGDNVYIVVKRERNVLTCIVQNQGGVVQTFQGHWGEGQPSSYSAPTVKCSFGVDFTQGDFSLTDYTVTTKDFGKEVLFGGDSITDGVGASFYTMAWPRMIEAGDHNTATFAMPSAKISDIIDMLPAIKLILPKKIVLLIGANNYISTVNIDTTKAHYTKLVDSLESFGIEVIISTLTPLDGWDVRPLNTWLLQTYGGHSFIDFFTGMADAGTYTLAAYYDSGDGIHPGNNAQPYMQHLAEQTLFYYDVGLRMWTRSTPPTIADIPAFEFIGWRNTSAGTTKLYYHDGTTLDSVSAGGSFTVTGTANRIALFDGSGILNTSPDFTHSSSRVDLGKDTVVLGGASGNVKVIRATTIPTTSYANAGGTGNRTSLITVTTNITSTGYPGTAEDLVDGTNPQTTYAADFIQAASGKYILFDFGSSASKYITETKWYQQDASTHGFWKWQGSNDNSTWDDLTSSYNLGGTLQTTTLTPTKGYRYYRLLGVSGNVSNNPYLYEVEFKVSDVVSEIKLQPSSGTLKIDGLIKLTNTPAGSNTDSVLVKHGSDSTLRAVSQSSLSGTTPTLQQVTTAGNNTTDIITSDIVKVWPVYGGSRYSGNWVASLGYSGNGVDAGGELNLRVFGYAALTTVKPQDDITTDDTYYLPNTGNGADTLATLYDLRALGGGGSTTTNAVTFNNSGSGAASGTTFDGSTARTISWNTIGAMAAAASVKTLSSQYTDASNTSTTETDLLSYTVGAGQLTADGDRIEVEGWFTYAANANTKTFKFKFGAYTATVSSGFVSSSGGSVKFKATIIRSGATSQRILWEFQPEFGTSTQAVASGSETLSGSVILKFTGQSGTASSDITQNTMTVTYYPAP